jgi:hypothetical protein
LGKEMIRAGGKLGGGMCCLLLVNEVALIKYVGKSWGGMVCTLASGRISPNSHKSGEK